MKIPPAIIIVLLAFCQLAGAVSAAEGAPPDTPGAFQVGHLTATATDHSRKRTLRYDIWYPASDAARDLPFAVFDLDEYYFVGHPVPLPSTIAHENAPPSPSGQFPLIIYSHSAGGTRWEAGDISQILASRGYVVVSCDHTGAGVASDYLNKDLELGDKTDPYKAYRLRGPDCRFLLDTVLARSRKRGDVLAGLIDSSLVGGFGWSMGGYSIASLAGGDKNFPGDRRLKAMVLLSPSTWMLSPSDLQRIRIPTMLLTGTEDTAFPELSDMYLRVSGPHRMARLKGAQHSSFAAWSLQEEYIMSTPQPQDVLDIYESTGGFDSPEVLAFQDEARRITTLYTVAAFDYYLKGQVSAESWLTPAYAQAQIPGVESVRVGVFPDLNGNDIPDAQDIVAGTSRDSNHDGVPDEVQGPVIRVNAKATGDGTGDSWVNANPDLRRALHLAAASRGRVREIWVAEGSYAPGGAEREIDTFFQIRNVALYGGFAGNEVRREQRDPSHHETVLTGDLQANDLPNFVNRDDNANSVVVTVRSDHGNIVDGFTIRGALGDAFGSGVQLVDGVLQDCIITDNQSSSGCGGLSASDGTDLIVRNCVFKGNIGTSGGALSLTGGSMLVANTLFEGNQAIDSNGAPGGGGAIFDYTNSYLSLESCVFSNNAGHDGGAIYIQDYSTPSTVSGVNCLFYGNKAEGSDGTKGSGDVLKLDAGQTALFTNITSDGQSSEGRPWLSDGNLSIRNSIVWDGVDWLQGEATVEYSDVEGGYPGLGNLTSDPMFTNPTKADFHLEPSSPCVDSGRIGLLLFGRSRVDGDRNPLARTLFDLSGERRVRGKAVDMGAYESR